MNITGLNPNQAESVWYRPNSGPLRPVYRYMAGSWPCVSESHRQVCYTWLWLLTPVSLQQIYTSQAWSSRCSEVVLILTCDLTLKIIAHFYLNSKYILLNFAPSPLFFKHPCMTNHHHDHPSWVPTFIMITITFIIICISYWKAAMDQESFATLWHPRNQIVYFGQYPNYSLLGL